MSIRCAMCGSSNVRTETKQEGYNKKKGIIGVALFGGVGALAGTSGNAVTYYHCAECQHVLNRCMPEYDKLEIEIALSHPDISEKDLIRWKKKYKNIEWEEAESSVVNIPTNSNNSTDNSDSFDEEFIESLESPILEYLEHNKDIEIVWNKREVAKKLDIEWDKFHIEVALAFKNLCDKGALKSEQGYFYLTSGVDEQKAVEKIQKLISKKNNQFEMNIYKVIDILKTAGVPLTQEDIKLNNAFCDISIQEITRICLKLHSLGIVNKNFVFDKRATYFSLVDGMSDANIEYLLEEKCN